VPGEFPHGQRAQGTFVYIDGRNLRLQVRKEFDRELFEANLPRLIESMVATERDSHLLGIRYYSAIAPESERSDRSSHIAFLEQLHAQGIKTFANELEPNVLGKLKEVGIDLKLSADMVVDFLRNKDAKNIIVISNDRDFSAAYDLIRDLATKFQRDVTPINVVVGNASSPPGARRRELSFAQYERYATSPINVIAQAQEQLRRDPAEALRLPERHQGVAPRRTSEPLGPPKHGTAYYFDLNSLGKAAKLQYGRAYLDINITKLAVDLGTAMGHDVRLARAYTSLHTPEHDLINHLLVRDMTRELERRGVVTRAFNYAYQNVSVARDLGGPGLATTVRASVAAEKHVAVSLLADVTKDILTGKASDIVLGSDDRSHWPIAELAYELGRMTKQHITVHNVHFGERHIDRMQSIRIEEPRYLELVERKDRAIEAQDRAAQILEGERALLETSLTKEFGTRRTIIAGDRFSQGVLVAKTAHLYAFDDEQRHVTIVGRLPVEPLEGVRYRLAGGSLHELGSRTVRERPILLVTPERAHEHGHSA
jgi:uncharacterized LabA/DUF88 family protein